MAQGAMVKDTVSFAGYTLKEQVRFPVSLILREVNTHFRLCVDRSSRLATT
jgi:hypothetical protein